MYTRPIFKYIGVRLVNQVFDDPAGDPPAGDPPTGDPESKISADDLPPGKWSDEQKAEIEKLIQNRVKNIQKKQSDVMADLEKFKNLSTMTEKEKEDLQTKLKDIERATLTKAEIAARERKEAEAKHKSELEKTIKERDDWKNKFTDTIIENEIINAAASKKAYRPEQVVKYLRNDARLIEVTEDGQPTGRFETRVSFMGRDKDGKPMKMDLPAVEALSEMEKLPDYANLFDSGLKGGLGKDNASGQTVPLDTALDDQAAFRKQRAEFRKVGT